MSTGAAWRIAIVCALAAVISALSLPDIALPWHPFGTFGFDADAAGRIQDVAPKSPASIAGLQPGDRIDLRATDPEARRWLLNAYTATPTGTSATYTVLDPRGQRRVVTLVATPRARSALDNAADVAQILSYAVFFITGTLLVILRPGRLTWSFFWYAIASAGGSLLLEANLPFALGVTEVALSDLSSLTWVPFVIFALRFPNDAIGGWKLILERVLLASLVVQIPATIYGGLGAVSVLPGAMLVARWMFQILPILGYALGAVIFGVTYLHAAVTDRPRIGWVIVGFLIGYGGLIVADINYFTGAGTWPIWVSDLAQTLNIAVPITVAYAIVKHRVIDVQFYLNRALVYGLLTTIAVCGLTLLHWLVSRELEDFHFGILVEVAGTLAIGFSIQRLHGWLENLVDRFVFRSVHVAQKHLAKTSAAMMYAASVAGLDHIVCTEPPRALRLAWAVVYHVDADGGYHKTAGSGDETAGAAFDRDDPMVLQMCASRHFIITRDFIAFPFIIRDELLGFALFGPHLNGSAVDPNEREILEAFVNGATIAYDHLDGKLRALENARLRVENDTLRSLVIGEGARPPQALSP